MKTSITAAILAASLGLAGTAQAQITVGFVTSQSGPGSSIGVLYDRGMKAAAEYAMSVGAEKIKLIQLDDGSDPSTATRNARKLVEETVHLLGRKHRRNALGQLRCGHQPRGAFFQLPFAHPVLEKYHPDSFAAVAEKVAKDKKPNILLLGRTEVGQDLAPMLSYRLDAGLLMDCLDLRIDPDSKTMIMERPVYGGNARSILYCETKPQMASVKPKTQDPLPKDMSRKGEVETISVDLNPSVNRTQFVEHVSWVSEGIQLEAAELIISGGRGMGSAEAYKATIDVAAQVIGGAAGASKAACDAGYAPPGNQVGLTGKRVSPVLYVAVAISGASQHLAGMGTSKNIVVVNRDPDANIFKVARYGVVADYKQVMPAFIEKLKELLAE